MTTTGSTGRTAPDPALRVHDLRPQHRGGCYRGRSTGELPRPTDHREPT